MRVAKAAGRTSGYNVIECLNCRLTLSSASASDSDYCHACILHFGLIHNPPTPDLGTHMKNIQSIKRKRKVTIKKISFKGKRVVFTGTLESMTRAQAKQKVLDCGGTVSNTVNQSTHYLVVGENPGSKYDDACFTDAQYLNEDDFLKIVCKAEPYLKPEKKQIPEESPEERYAMPVRTLNID